MKKLKVTHGLFAVLSRFSIKWERPPKPCIKVFDGDIDDYIFREQLCKQQSER